MTENEAIKILKKTTEHTKVYEDDVVFTSDFVKAYEKAIQALEEIQQYRAIGTVEGYERAIETSIENYNLYKEYKAKVDELEAIGTIEELQQAINFKKYFMELYSEGLEVANWHKNGDLEPLVNFIDEACN